MRFFAILSDSLRVFASFTYCEYTRASPNTVFSIIADYRHVSLILIYFTRFYAIFRNFIRFSASFREFHILRVYPSFPEHIIPDYRRDSLILSLFYVRLLSISSRTPLYVTFHTSAPFLFSYSSLMVQREAFLFTFSYHFILFSRSFSEIFGHSRRLLKTFPF